MIDRPKQVEKVMQILKDNLPFKVYPRIELIDTLKNLQLKEKQSYSNKNKAESSDVNLEIPEHNMIINDKILIELIYIDYDGDKDGIMCHLKFPYLKGFIIFPLIAVVIPFDNPLMPAIKEYQLHRIKKNLNSKEYKAFISRK